ncbi:unnamed protein product [Linum trigynum]|uniref:Secreted protein n=1 Tax=Linum trigynum TaxID=586398 RepID=A0AAV2FSX2_9ROSI
MGGDPSAAVLAFFVGDGSISSGGIFSLSFDARPDASSSFSMPVWFVFLLWPGDAAAVGGDSTAVTLLLIRARSRVNSAFRRSQSVSHLIVRASSLQRHSWSAR